MIPANLFGLVLFVLVPAPGWLWVRVAEKREVQADRSPLLEAAELATTGVVFTAIAVTVTTWVSDRAGWLPELRVVTARGSTYAQEEPYRTAGAVAVVFGLSLAVAHVTARFVYRGMDASLVSPSSVWRDVFREGGEKRPIFVSAELSDGRVLDGFLFSYSTEGGDRDLALQAPIYVWSGEPRTRMQLHHTNRTVIQADQMVAMWVRYEWDRS